MADDLQSITIPPPVGGWNSKDPISQMDPTFAVEGENYFSDAGTVFIRNGSRQYAKNVTPSLPFLDAVGALGELALQNGTRKLVGISSYTLRPWNITSGSSPTDLSGGGAAIINAAAAQMVNFKNRIFIKDQLSTPTYYWDGASATVTHAAFTGPSGGDINLANPMPYKSRLYFTSSDASIWFGDVNAITGAMSQFDVQTVLTQGGTLRFVGGLTQTGDSVNNYLCLVSDTGEVLLYSGDSPNSSNWALAGHYYMPPPVGIRSFFYWGADLVVITIQGVVLMSDVLKGDNDLVFLTENINDQFIAIASAPNASYSQGAFYPRGNMLFINIWTLNGPVQFVMNTLTRAWWKWSGLTAWSVSLFSNDLYFGTGSLTAGGKVFQLNTGDFDEDPESEGSALTRTCKLRPAYNYLGERTVNKQFIAASPIMYESQGLNVTVGADVDYRNTTGTINMTDSADTSYRLYQRPIDLAGSPLGKAVSLRFDDSVTTKRRSIQAIDIQYKDAGEVGADII